MENEPIEETVETQNAETVETVETIETVEEVENVEETVETVEVTEAEAEVTETQAEATGEALFTEKDVLEKFGNICGSMEQLVELAKEGLEIRNETISQALESGVHSMGNAFNKDIFTKTFSNMKTKDIKEMAEVWEKQANDMFAKEKVSKQDFSNEKEETFKVDYSQYKTGLY